MFIHVTQLEIMLPTWQANKVLDTKNTLIVQTIYFVTTVRL